MIIENLRLFFLLIFPFFYIFPAGGQVSGTITPYQLVFSEIMADPTPVKGLPPCEYLELYNRGITAVDLSGYKLSAGSHSLILPSCIVLPQQYVVLCDSAYAESYPQANAIAVDLPAISNEGQTLILKSSADKIVHSVRYNSSWYQSHVEGGISLEMIDMDNPCAEQDNWKASVNPNGGTPGFTNSVADLNPDSKAPFLLRVSLPDDSSLVVYFSESLNPLTAGSVYNYSVNHNFLHPHTMQLIEPDYRKVLLKYLEAFNDQYGYMLTVLPEFEDCAGNKISGNTTVEFAVPQTPESYGLVFNEILFHTSEDCGEFIEIYNRSSKPFDFKDLKIGICDLTDFQITREVSFDKSPYLLMPGKYMVITADARKLPHDLFNTHPELILENSDFFALPDVEGLVVLTNMAGAIMDEFHYNRDYHASMLGNDLNISLEKTDPDMPSGLSSSWCSASSLSGYSTPGFRNSQIITDSRSIDVSLSTDMITPDDDGIDDVLEISIKASDPGCMGTLSIFNMWGELVNSLLKNSFLGTDMRLTWDAKDMNDHILNIGPYIIYVEIIKPSGKIEKIKKVVSVIRRNN